MHIMMLFKLISHANMNATQYLQFKTSKICSDSKMKSHRYPYGLRFVSFKGKLLAVKTRMIT